MGRSLDKFILLMWKNWKLQYRKPIQTAIEIITPVAFAFLLVVTRNLVDPELQNEIIYQPYCPFAPVVEKGIEAKLNISLCDTSDSGGDPLNMTNLATLSLVYSPNNTVINEVMKYFYPIFGQIKGFPDSKAMEDYYSVHSSNSVAAGIQFDYSPQDLNRIEDLKDMTIYLRFPSELRVEATDIISNWRTDLVFPLFQYPGPRSPNYTTGADPNYYGEGFLALQYFVTTALVLAKKNVSVNNVNEFLESDFPFISMRRFAYASWYSDVLLEALRNMFPLIIMMSFVYTCINTVKSVTTEKEKQLKEAMKIMGLPNWLHWTAWFIKCFTFLFISVLLMVILMKVKWYSHSDYAVLTYSNTLLLFVFMLLYICASITFCFALSVFFSKANNAATIAGLAWFISYVPYTFVQQNYETLSLPTKLLMSLLHNSGMSFGFTVVLMYEGSAEGVQWNNLFNPISSDDNLSLGLVMIMLALDSILYMSVALYVEAVLPGEYGVAQPWNFIFKKSYWVSENAYTELEYNGVGKTPVSHDEAFFEPGPKHLQAGIDIKTLSKIYGDKVAVNGLSLKMYQNQITVLLGHNGAGKTTTMSMLTGMIRPTSGTASISGYDIRDNITGVRQSLGLCPQHNIIFDELTVAEHIYFFSKLKGLDRKQTDAEIDKYLKLLDLEPKRNAKSSTLSGGMKRKLCVGMALCGDSKIVMLDEPSSGMDPSARRVLWDLIQKQKEGRTILLSTHFMDEADLLGDRIAIMAAGQLQCCGSSFFLKKKYGTGYSLIMDKDKNCDVHGVTQLLKNYIPDLEVHSNVGSELSYLLAENQSAAFEPMLRNLENESKNLGIRSYGISLTTLEEVFMKVGADHSQDIASGAKTPAGSEKSGKFLDVSMSPSHTGGSQLILNQFRAMLMKKIISVQRSWFLLILQFIIPSFFLCVAILQGRNMATTGALPAAAMTLGRFSDTKTLVHNTTLNEYMESYQNILKGHTSIESSTNLTARMLSLTASVPGTVRRNYIVGASFENSNTNPNRPSLTAYFNNDPYHSPGIALGYLLNAVYQVQTDCSDCSVNFVNHPFAYTAETQVKKLTGVENRGFQLSFNVGFSMAFVSAFYVLFVVREIVSKSKHLQFVSGIKVWIFWTASFICDMLTYLITVIIYIITLICWQEEGFTTASDIGRVFLIMFYFGWCFLPTIYLLGYFFKVPSTGFTRVMLISIFTGCVAFMVIQIFQTINENLEDIGKTLHWAFLVSPFYSVITGMSESYTTYSYYSLCNKAYEACLANGMTKEECNKILSPQIVAICLDAKGDYYRWAGPGIGRNLVYSFVEGIVLFALLFTIEYKLFSRIIYFVSQKIFPRHPLEIPNEDSDVAEERERIQNGFESGLNSGYILALKDLTKYYKSFLAVNGLSLGVKTYECFGLLGINGAGKTTTFKMMTGDETISYGDGWVNGHSIKTDLKKVQKIIGYCPQFDALLDDMTARETIIMFALIRGIEYNNCLRLPVRLAQEFDFVQHLDKKVKEMSGGNKRKLSTSLSLVGDPPILYLDEPTTGMDPATKRYLWNALCRIRDSGKSVILTSHSMEECEALCTRLAIMVNGNFKCLGSTQHLKSKFADGYSLTIKIRKRPESSGFQHSETDHIETFIRQYFPNAELKEKHEELLSYHIRDKTVSWSRMFGILEEGKRRNPDIEDYSIGQSSLEQVFLTFTGERY